MDRGLCQRPQMGRTAHQITRIFRRAGGHRRPLALFILSTTNQYHTVHYGRILWHHKERVVRDRPLLRCRLQLALGHQTRRYRDLRKRRLQTGHTQHRELILPLEIRGRTARVFRQFGYRRHQRHRRPTHHHQLPPGQVCHRHRGQNQQRGRTRKRVAGQRQPFQRTQQQHHQPVGTGLDDYQPGQKLHRGNQAGTGEDKGLLLHAAPDRAGHHRRPRQVWPHPHSGGTGRKRICRVVGDLQLPQPGL